MGVHRDPRGCRPTGVRPRGSAPSLPGGVSLGSIVPEQEAIAILFVSIPEAGKGRVEKNLRAALHPRAKEILTAFDLTHLRSSTIHHAHRAGGPGVRVVDDAVNGLITLKNQVSRRLGGGRSVAFTFEKQARSRIQRSRNHSRERPVVPSAVANTPSPDRLSYPRLGRRVPPSTRIEARF